MGLFDFLGGGGNQTITEKSNIPAWVSEAGRANFQTAAALAARPYQPYTAPRVAPFTADQNKAFALTRQTVGDYKPLLSQASQTTAAAAKPITGNYGVRAQPISAPSIAAAQTGVRQMKAPGNIAAAQTGVRQMKAPGNIAAAQTAMRQMKAPGSVAAAQTGVRQMKAPGNIAATKVNATTTQMRQQAMPGQVRSRDVGTQSFLDANVSAYMNPYLDEVLARTLEDVRREGEIARKQIGAGAAMSGAFGDARHGIVESEQRRNELDTAGDLSAQLRAAGYDQALAAFDADRMARMQADLANQGANLQAALANQAVQESVGGRNLAAAMGIDQANADRLLAAGQMNQDALLRAAMANQGMQFETGRTNLEAALGVDSENAARLMQARLANQDMQFQTGRTNLEAAMGIDSENAARLMQARLANQDTQRFTNATNLQAALGVDSENAARLMQARLANQGMQFETGRTNLQAALGVDQDNAARLMQARLANQGASLEAGRANQAAALDAAQFSQNLAAQIQMQNRQNALGAGSQFGDLARLASQLGYQDAAALAGIGEAQQAQGQRSLDLRYEDFLRQQDWPYQQLNVRTAALAGTPYSTVATRTAPGPNTTAQTLGGIAALTGALGGAGGIKSILDWL